MLHLLKRTILVPAAIVVCLVSGDAGDASADNVKFPPLVAMADAAVDPSMAAPLPAATTEDAGVVDSLSLGGGKPLAAVAEPPQTPPEGTPTVPDPVESPGGFYEGVKDLGKKGWPLAIVVGLLAVATALRKRVSWFSEPGTKRAAVTSGVVAVAGVVAARLAGVDGIAWADVIVVVASAVAYAMHSTTKPAS